MRKRNQKVKENNNRFNYLWFVAFVFIVFVAGTIFLTIQTTASGAEVSYLENELEKLERENKELVHQLEASSSISILSEKADSLGFIKPSEILYTQKEEPFAKLP